MIKVPPELSLKLCQLELKKFQTLNSKFWAANSVDWTIGGQSAESIKICKLLVKIYWKLYVHFILYGRRKMSCHSGCESHTQTIEAVRLQTFEKAKSNHWMWIAWWRSIQIPAIVCAHVIFDPFFVRSQTGVAGRSCTKKQLVFALQWDGKRCDSFDSRITPIPCETDRSTTCNRFNPLDRSRFR